MLLCSGVCPTASKIVSKGFEKGGVHEVVSFVANDQLLPSEPVWANYIKGVVAEYTQSAGPDGKKCVPEGKYLCFEAAICSSVPLGSVSRRVEEEEEGCKVCWVVVMVMVVVVDRANRLLLTHYDGLGPLGARIVGLIG